MNDDCGLTTYAEMARTIEMLPFLVHETRRQRRLSLRAAATEIGVNFSTLTRIEHGTDSVTSSIVPILRWLDASG